MMARVSSPPASDSDPRTRPIGVFDSGVGGLTVLHELLVQLPNEDFLYLGDTERFPYGERAGEEFDARAVETVREACAPLCRAQVDTVVLGCTHYPLISPMLQRMLGPQVSLITSGAALARQVGHALSTRSLANPHPGEGEYRF